MQEHTAGYVADQQLPARAAPPGEHGILSRVRKNLFATPTDAALTIILGSFAAWVVWSLLNWGLFNATFTGGDRAACLHGEGEAEGACWAFVAAKFSQFMYGAYPFAERWRPDLVGIVMALLVVGIAVPRVPFKRLNALLLFGVFPIFALIMLTGAGFRVSGGFTVFLVLVGALVSFLTHGEDAGGLESGEGKAAAGMIVAAAALLLLSGYDYTAYPILGIRFGLADIAAIVLLIGSALVVAIGIGRRVDKPTWPPLVAPIVGLVIALLLSEDYGLRPVPTTLWGGLMLTLVVAITGIAASLPLGVLLALGRQSDMPAIRTLCVIFIEFWRGVPLITVLFMAAFMLPLFVPAGVTFNQLLRALVGVALFSAAYMAEVIRGGLQAIPKGQYEGAQSLGLSYWQSMRLIILPQALKLVIPGIVNTFIGLFKDTSLVYIIGLADLLGAVRRGFSDPNWITPSTAATGLIFAGFVFWLFCFGMSRYSLYVERRLDTGYKR